MKRLLAPGWHIRPTASDRYKGTASDMEGVAQGQSAGNTFHWRYSMNVKNGGNTRQLHFGDGMYLRDGSHLFTRTAMKKPGIIVATVALFFTKKGYFAGEEQ
ncbi:DUF3833 domain-containing protein [Yokenella regensburgei]